MNGQAYLDIHKTNYGTYVLIWLGLVALTTLTVAVAGLNLSVLTVVVALAIAITKSLLVASYFMHLKSDSFVFKIFVIVCIITFIIIIAGTVFDIILTPRIK